MWLDSANCGPEMLVSSQVSGVWSTFHNIKVFLRTILQNSHLGVQNSSPFFILLSAAEIRGWQELEQLEKKGKRTR